MKAKTLTNNLKFRLANRGNKGYSLGRRYRLYRGRLLNTEVRYLTQNGNMMFCDDGEYALVRFKPETTSHHSLVRG